MAAYTVEEIFNGNKYSVMSEMVKEILRSGPYELPEDEQTAMEMAYVKHTILVLREMEKNGDMIDINDSLWVAFLYRLDTAPRHFVIRALIVPL